MMCDPFLETLNTSGYLLSNEIVLSVFHLSWLQPSAGLKRLFTVDRLINFVFAAQNLFQNKLVVKKKLRLFHNFNVKTCQPLLD